LSERATALGCGSFSFFCEDCGRYCCRRSDRRCRADEFPPSHDPFRKLALQFLKGFRRIFFLGSLVIPVRLVVLFHSLTPGSFGVGFYPTQLLIRFNLANLTPVLKFGNFSPSDEIRSNYVLLEIPKQAQPMKRLSCAAAIDSIVRSVIRKRTFGEVAANDCFWPK
jgi:hypothetical protein